MEETYLDLKIRAPRYQFNVADGALIVNTYRWPNWFHRFTQRWMLGIKWSKIDDTLKS